MKKLGLTILILIITLASCKNKSTANKVIHLPPLPTQFSLNDLKAFSISKHGFVLENGQIDNNYGRLECIDPQKDLFVFWCGLGACGDGLEVNIVANNVEQNTFDIFISRGKNYYGHPTLVDRKIGSLMMNSTNEVKGNIKYCSNEESCCIEMDFIIRKIDQENVSNSDNSLQQPLNIGILTSIPQYAKKEVSECINCCLVKGIFGVSDSEQELIGIFIKKGLLVKINNEELLLKFKASGKGTGNYKGYRVDRYENGDIVFNLITMETNATGFRDGKLEVYNKNILVQQIDINETQCL
jgi:hypothetical protein